MSNHFIYTPLETATTFRIAYIPETPNPSDGILDIRLEHHEMSTMHKKYTALSYVWGNSTRSELVRLNGKKCLITASLMYALQCKRTGESPWWIDAICIDQSRDEDKNQQIPLMTAIYSNAMVVRIELGVPSELELSAFRKIDGLCEVYYRELKRVAGENDGDLVAEKVVYPFVSEYDHAFWMGVAEILNRPWWRRTWTVQEGTTSAETVFALGDVCVQRRHFNPLAFLAREMDERKAWGTRTSPGVNWLFSDKLRKTSATRRQPDHRVGLFDMLNEFRNYEATVSKDRIYAAQCLCNDALSLTFKANYHNSFVGETTSLIATQIDIAGFPLDFLGYSGTLDYDFPLPVSWPTWLPCWDRKFLRTPFAKHFDGQGSSPRTFNPWGTTTTDAQASAHQRPRIQDATLHAFGFLIDTITGSTHPILNLNPSIAAKSISEWHTALPNKPYPTGETQMSAFLCTLVADLSFDPYIGKPDRRNAAAEWDTTVGQLSEGHKETSKLSACYYPRIRRLAFTQRGYMGLVNHQVEAGDLVYMLRGGSVLYVLRECEDKYLFLGEAYFHGLMDGEALEFLGVESAGLCEVCIV